MTNELTERCRREGLRITTALKDLLNVLAEAGRPMTHPELVAEERLSGRYDQTTIYRLLLRLEEKGILRRLGFHARAAYYSLQVDDAHREYLICRDCGRIEPLEMSCPVADLEARVARLSGYTGLTHELEFYGVCPRCAP